jgi:hypothetical protein
MMPMMPNASHIILSENVVGVLLVTPLAIWSDDLHFTGIVLMKALVVRGFFPTREGISAVCSAGGRV